MGRRKDDLIKMNTKAKERPSYKTTFALINSDIEILPKEQQVEDSEKNKFLVIFKQDYIGGGDQRYPGEALIPDYFKVLNERVPYALIFYHTGINLLQRADIQDHLIALELKGCKIFYEEASYRLLCGAEAIKTRGEALNFQEIITLQLEIPKIIWA